MGKKLTRDEFIKKGNTVHNSKYDYSKVDYVNNTTKVCIICPEHGEFWQTPGNHTMGQGCPKCAGKGNTCESIIDNFKKTHGNKYDYSKVDFKRVDKKVCIICPIHGEFYQEPRQHLKGMGCKYCAGKETTTKEFIRKAREVHGGKYDYSKSEFITNKTKVCIICPVHGEFWQEPGNHVNGKNGCPRCGYEEVRNKLNLKLSDFLKRAYSIHGDYYDYSKVNYVNCDTKVCIICPEHGEFWQTPYKHTSCRYGCPKCSSTHMEFEVRKLLNEHNIVFEEQKSFDWLKYKNKLRLDFFIPEFNIAIECQGEQHFRPVDFGNMGYEYANKEFDLIVKRDKIKKKLCETHNIKLLYYSTVNNENYPYYVYKEKDILIKEIKNAASNTK